MADIKQADLVEALGQSMGSAKASEVVTQAAATLGLKGDPWSREEALKVLERIGETPGLIGSAAKLTRTKMHLRWAKMTAAGGG